jgi:hypothetical protein
MLRDLEKQHRAITRRRMSGGVVNAWLFLVRVTG